MLAYVFWHTPAPSADLERYERLLIDFHKTLGAHAPGGFRTSLVFRIANAPWIGAGGNAYEDWDVIDNSAALDPTNAAAVPGPRKAPHVLVPSSPAPGAAGLYPQKPAHLAPINFARHAAWFSKPAVTYD